MSSRIIDALRLGAGSARSISLDRDLYEPHALDHYVVTPTAIAALTQLGQGLERGSAQRAWKIVGPYGSGKSALALVVGQLLAGQKHFPLVTAKVEAVSQETVTRFGSADRYPVAIVGSRISFGAAFAHALDRIVARWKSKPSVLFRRRLAEGRTSYDGVPVNRAVAAMSSDFVDAAVAEGFSGVVFLVDELGKFVEHAALRPDEGDLIALQQLAEQACGQADDRIFVIAMLHQPLASYGGNVGRALSDEWEKVASRFEEIPFDEPIERYAHFAAYALAPDEQITGSSDLRTSAKSLYAAALDFGALRSQSEADAKLFAAPHSLYPLHPLVIAAAAVIAKRLGQSERSFHSFLRGDEPFALRQFANEKLLSPATWYRLSDLFDNLAAAHSIRFRDRNAERRWLFALSCVDRQTPESACAAVLKTVAVLELVQGTLRLPLTASLLSHALDSYSPGEIKAILAELSERGVLHHRRERDEYTLAVAEIANIEALVEVAASEDESKLIVRALTTALASRSTVAHRHYDRTGTLRTLGVSVGTLDAWPTSPKTGSEELVPDAWLKLVVVASGSKEAKEAEQRFKLDREELVVHACMTLRGDDRRALVEYATWLAVQQQLSVKHLDPWADRYTDQRLQEAREAVNRLLTARLTSTGGRSQIYYWHDGAPVEAEAASTLSQLASWLFDKQFPLAPCLINELINKDRPPSAITLARQRMFEVVLGDDDARQVSGPAEYPPERLILWSLLQQTGLLTESSNGRWLLGEPNGDTAVAIKPIWERIELLLCPGAAMTFKALVDELALPPYGVRAAPAGVWIAMYLVIRRHSCAIFERGTLVLELTAEHLMRMFKAPALFEIRELADVDPNRRLLADYQAAFASVGCTVNGAATHVELTRGIYRWLGRLPTFARETSKLGKDTLALRTQFLRAQDQIELLSRTLPELHRASKSNQPFGQWLSTSLSELGSVQRHLQSEVSNVIGASFEIAGPLGRVRDQLQRECSTAANGLGEQHLKAFVLRCADPTLTDERWLDSIATLVVQRPLDAWSDSTLALFESTVAELCAQYKRWIRAMSQRASNPGVGERWLSLTMTLPGGEEAAVFVVANERSKEAAGVVLDALRETAAGDRSLMIAILGQALLQCQVAGDTMSQTQKASDERQKAG